MRPVLAAALVLATALCAARDHAGAGLPDATVRALDEAVARHMADNNLPGLAIGIWVPGEGEYVVARGKANLATGLPRDTEAPFRIGSITKPAVGTVILQLIEAGRLSKTQTTRSGIRTFPMPTRSPSTICCACAAASRTPPMTRS